MTPPAPILYAFDPGKTTGWAKFQHRLEGWDLTDWGIFLDWHGFMNVSFKRAFCNTHAKVVYERLRTNLPYFDPIGLEVIGVPVNNHTRGMVLSRSFINFVRLASVCDII